MASLPEINTFPENIYQMETTDPAEAGPDGVMNIPLKALTNRTRYLKNKSDGHDTSIGTLTTGLADEISDRTDADTEIRRFIPKFRGRTVTFDVANQSVGTNLAGAGFTSMLVTADDETSTTFRVVMPSAIASSNYSVVMSVETTSANIITASTIFIPVWKKINGNTFDVVIREATAITQSVIVHIQVFDLN